MKVNVGDAVTVKNVPERAKQFGITEGMFGNIVPIEDEESRVWAEEMGMVMVRIHNGFPFGPIFWWKVTDLVHRMTVQPVKLTIVDEGHHVLGKPSAQGKRAFSFGYDPYNSVHAHLIYLRMRMAGIYATA